MKTFIAISVALMTTFATANAAGLSDFYAKFEEHVVVADEHDVTARHVTFVNDEHEVFRDQLEEVLVTGEINFAGNYLLTSWSQGSNFVVGFIVDRETGTAYPLPVAGYGYEFFLTSNLLVLDRLPHGFTGDHESWVATRYYTWDERAKQFVLIEEVSPPEIS